MKELLYHFCNEILQDIRLFPMFSLFPIKKPSFAPNLRTLNQICGWSQNKFSYHFTGGRIT